MVILKARPVQGKQHGLAVRRGVLQFAGTSVS
jgi:hypothetical protein